MTKGLRLKGGITANFQRLRKQACDFIEKEALPQVFSREFCEIAKSSFLTEHLRWLLLTAVNDYMSKRIWYIFDNTKRYKKKNEKYSEKFLLIQSIPQSLPVISSEKKIQIFPVTIVQVNAFFFTSTLVKNMLFKKLLKIDYYWLFKIVRTATSF